MKPSFRVVVAIAATVLSSTVMAGARDQMTAFSKGLKALDARFDQRVYDPDGRQIETSSGNVKLSAPRQFRWEYEKPPQLIVADGDRIWIYDPDLEQVTVRDQGIEEQRSPLAVLIDPAELDRQYKVSEGGTAEGLNWLVLQPRKTDDAPFQRARLGFGEGGLVRMELQDALGQRTLIGFSAWHRNPQFPPGTFSFTPPAGTAVVGDVSPGPQGSPIRN